MTPHFLSSFIQLNSITLDIFFNGSGQRSPSSMNEWMTASLVCEQRKKYILFFKKKQAMLTLFDCKKSLVCLQINLQWRFCMCVWPYHLLLMIMAMAIIDWSLPKKKQQIFSLVFDWKHPHTLSLENNFHS